MLFDIVHKICIGRCLFDIIYNKQARRLYAKLLCVVTAEAPYPVKVHIFVPHLVQLNLFNRHPQTHISDDKKHTFEGQKHTFYCFLISFAARLNVFLGKNIQFVQILIL